MAGRSGHEIRDEVFELCRKSEGLKDVSEQLMQAIAENIEARQHRDNGMRRRRTDHPERRDQHRGSF